MLRRSLAEDLGNERVDALGDVLDGRLGHGELVASAAEVNLDPLEDPEAATPAVLLVSLVARGRLVHEGLEAKVHQDLLGPDLRVLHFEELTSAK